MSAVVPNSVTVGPEPLTASGSSTPSLDGHRAALGAQPRHERENDREDGTVDQPLEDSLHDGGTPSMFDVMPPEGRSGSNSG